MAKWYKMPTGMTITEGDYRAGLNAMNIVFGAVLGFVLVGGEDLPVRDFVGLLAISGLIVMLIQSIALSPYKLFNITTTAMVIYFLPKVAEDFFSISAVPKVQPTHAVWAAMAVVLEISPREKTDSEKINSEDTKQLNGETTQ